MNIQLRPDITNEKANVGDIIVEEVKNGKEKLISLSMIVKGVDHSEEYPEYYLLGLNNDTIYTTVYETIDKLLKDCPNRIRVISKDDYILKEI